MAAGLPTEGTNASLPTAGTVARADVPTCGLHEELGSVSHRVQQAGWSTCVVVNDERIVLGLLRADQLGGDPTLPVERAMRPGPSTFRPNVPIAEMAEYMGGHELESAPVTTSEGRLVGLLLRTDVETAAHEATSADSQSSST